MTPAYRLLLLSLAFVLACLPLRAELEIITEEAAEGPAIEVPEPVSADAQAEVEADPFPDLLVFKNADRLHGRLLAATSDESLLWQHRDIAEPVTIGLDNIFAVSLGTLRELDWMEGQTRVQLTNDDVLLGQVLSLGPEALLIDTPYGGEISVKRSMINTIEPAINSQGKLLYEGPNDISEWEKSSGEWEVRGDDLTGYGRIGADIKLPDTARLRFSVRWPASFSNFAIAIYTPDLKNFYNDAYHLTFSGNNVSMHRRSRNHGTLNLGQVQIDHLMGQRKARIEILVSKEERTFALLFDDQLVKEWSDPQGFAGLGQGIVFNSHDRNAPMSITDIRVSEWDGKLSSIGELEAGEMDILQLANFDRVTGEIESITDDTVTFKTPYATMNVPLSRVATLAFAEERAERARRNSGDIELYFEEGEHLTLQLQALDEKVVTGYSENTGVVTLDVSAFGGLRFNIYDEHLEEDAGDATTPIVNPADNQLEIQNMQQLMQRMR